MDYNRISTQEVKSLKPLLPQTKFDSQVQTELLNDSSHVSKEAQSVVNFKSGLPSKLRTSAKPSYNATD